MLADMKARWPKADYRENARAHREDRAARYLKRRNGEVRAAASAGHAMADQGVAGAARKFRRGKVATYRTIAEKVGDAKASRAVGTAVGRNPISWLIPCHRVLGSDGALHGYHWGLPRKRAMLAVEAARAA